MARKPQIQFKHLSSGRFTPMWVCAATVQRVREGSPKTPGARQMTRLLSLSLLVVLSLGACAPGSGTQATLAPDGKPLPRVYRIGPAESSRIQFRILDGVNSLRQAAGAGPVQMDPRLNAAAATHARDMSVQNRPWHFGSDGSSPIDRVQRVGYTGQLRGELISETYESEVETLGAWMQDPATRAILMDPQTTNIGFAWHQEQNGKIWWTMVTGS